ncbi:uncharacterized protein KIAA2012 homolog [Pseudophryne corroboree]|uniref:uncharacterized protein KIAA2012 homolog n=1 Tax=Pseudophryne corroboree TaxID=495146 RepID=UPI003081B839
MASLAESAGDERQSQAGDPEEPVYPGAERRVRPLQMDIAWNVEADTDGDVLPMSDAPPLGSLPSINGKKGPGNQCSMANVKASIGNGTMSSKGLPTGIIRGSLPEELKECCKGSSVGSLIMSPNGEIVCLSLMGAARDTDIPIRFDFIAEEEKEECLLERSAGRDEESSDIQQDPETEAASPNLHTSEAASPNLHTSEAASSNQHTPERGTSPPYHKAQGYAVYKGKKIPNVETAMQGNSAEQLRDQTAAEKSPREKEKAVTGGQKTDIQASQRRDVRHAPIMTAALPQENMECISSEIETAEPSIVSTRDFQNDNAAEELPSPRGLQKSPRSPHRGEETPQQKLTQTVHKSPWSPHRGEESPQQELTQTVHQTKNEELTEYEKSETSPDHTEVRPAADTLSLPVQGRQGGGDATAPPTAQEQHSSSRTSSRNQPNTKQKTSDTAKKQPAKPRKKHPEIVTDVEKVPSEGREVQPDVPPPTEDIAESNSGPAQRHIPGQEEALAAQSTKTLEKENTRPKGKNKTEKAKKPKKPEARVSKRANQGAAAEQGKSAFVVGQPRHKKAEDILYHPKRPPGQVQRQETLHEAQGEEEHETDNESEDSYVVERHEERTPTPTAPTDLHSSSDTAPTDLHSGADTAPTLQAAEKRTTSTDDATSQADDDQAYSEASEAASELADFQAAGSSVHQRRSSRARALSEKAERRRLEVERKRREREEQLHLEREQQERMEKMQEELEEQQRRRAEEMRLRKQQEEEEKLRQAQEAARRMQLEQQAVERARQQQEEHRRKLQEIQKRKQQEEMERKALENQRQKELERLEAEERLRLLEMAADEREEYIRRKREKEEQDRREAEERRLKAEEEARAIMEEAQRRAQLLARQTAALEQQLQFNRGLLKESLGMDQTQGVSRPWVFSYFEFLELLGLPLPVEGE